MPLRKSSAVFLLVGLLQFKPGFGFAAPLDQTISGRFFFEGGEFRCDNCVVTLLMSGLQPVATVFVDPSGRFVFRGTERARYTIHAEIDGFEEVNYPVETSDLAGSDIPVTIVLARKIVRPAAGVKDVVDVSEFLEKYAKKAVEAYRKGVENGQKNRNDRAIIQFEDATRLAPDFYAAHNSLGLAYKIAGRFEDAEREFLRAHQLNPSAADPLVNLTRLYLDGNQPERAVSTGEEAVKADSRSAPGFLNLGMALYKVALLDRAEAALKKALELAPKMANVRLMLANVYLKLRDRDKLLNQLDSYLTENPNGDQRRVVQEMREKVLSTTSGGRP